MLRFLQTLRPKKIYLFPVRNGGEVTNQFRVQDTLNGIPPKVGMFAVLNLDGSEILVRFLKELPFAPDPLDVSLNNLDSNEYRYVRPKLDATEVAVGRNITLFVGSVHFLVEIVEVLQSPNVQSGIRCTVDITVTPPTPLPVNLSMLDSPRFYVTPSASHLSSARLAPPARVAPPRSIPIPPPAEIVSANRIRIQPPRRKKPGLPPTPETSPEPGSTLSLPVTEHTIPRRPVPGSSSTLLSWPNTSSSQKDLPSIPDTASSTSRSSTSSYGNIPPARPPNPKRQAFVAQPLPSSSRRPPDPDSFIVTNSTQQSSSIIEPETPTSSTAPESLNHHPTDNSLQRQPSRRQRTAPFRSSPLSNEIRSSPPSQPNNIGMEALNLLTVAEAPVATATPFNLPPSRPRTVSIATGNSAASGSKHSRSASVAVHSTRNPSASASASASEKGKQRHSHHALSSPRAPVSGPPPAPERSDREVTSLSRKRPTPGLGLNLTLPLPIASSTSSRSTPVHIVSPSSSTSYCRHYKNNAHDKSPTVNTSTTTATSTRIDGPNPTVRDTTGITRGTVGEASSSRSQSSKNKPSRSQRS